MSLRFFKIYCKQDFEHFMKGIQVVQCIQDKSPENKLINNLEDLAISDSLCCSYCNATFENNVQQRQHYKLDWHRFNLKQHLDGLESISENEFNLLVQKNKRPKTYSDSEIETEVSEDDDYCSLNDESYSQPDIEDKSITGKKFVIENTMEYKSNSNNGKSKNNDLENNTTTNIITPYYVQHSKIFFQNEEGKFFGIYQCLLFSKKEIPEINNQLIGRALECGKKSMWTVILVGGGHFAGAVFSEGNSLVHKTLHYYTVRAKQGSLQKTRDNRSSSGHSKSAGTNIRRHNQTHLLQHVQEILDSWSSYIVDSSLILYRAVGAYNRSILFSGKSAPFNKRDSRLRQLPFPTSRPTYNEVKRVYDVLSTIEVHSHRLTSKNLSSTLSNSSEDHNHKNDCTMAHLNVDTSKYLKIKNKNQFARQYRSSRINVDRAKPRKSPHRPLPNIVVELARSSSESEIDTKDYELMENNHDFFEQNFEIDLRDRLVMFDQSTTNHTRNKRQQKQRHQKTRRNINEVTDSWNNSEKHKEK